MSTDQPGAGASTKEEAKPCPFCGHTAIDEDGDADYSWLVCRKCGARTGGCLYPPDAVEAWNERHAPTVGADVAAKVEAPLTLKELVRNYRHKIAEAMPYCWAACGGIAMNTDPDWQEWADVAAAMRLVELLQTRDATVTVDDINEDARALYFDEDDGWYVGLAEPSQCSKDKAHDSLGEALLALVPGPGQEDGDNQ